MTLDDVVDAALARLTEFGSRVPAARSVAYRRVNQRQQFLYAWVANKNPDYYGTDVVLPLTLGVGNLDTLDPAVALVKDVRIEVPGAYGLGKSYALGDVVNIVPSDDYDADLPPRMTLRGGTLAGVETDLSDGTSTVTSVRVYYSKQPTDLTLGTDVIALPNQFTELLVIDLTRDYLRKASATGTEVPDAILALLDAEEQVLLDEFAKHLESFYWAEQPRFLRQRAGDAKTP